MLATRRRLLYSIRWPQRRRRAAPRLGSGKGAAMKPPLKLSAIDQEHLQELYDAAGVARDELPYTQAFEDIWQGVQDRPFKNAARGPVFGAVLEYTRSR